MVFIETTQRSIMSVKLSDYLKHELDKRGWTRREAADKFGISATALTMLINIPERVPDLPTLRGIADGLKEPLARLLDLAGYPVEREALTPSSLTPEEEAFINRLTPQQRRLALDVVRQMLGETPDS